MAESTARRLLRLAALGCFALPPEWTLLVSACLAAAGELRWGGASPRTPHLVLAAAGASVALAGLPAWAGFWRRPVDALASQFAGGVDVGWSLLLCPGSLALLLAAAFLSARRAGLALALHGLLCLVFLAWVGGYAVPRRIDEASFLLSTFVYQVLVWGLAAAGVLWADEAGCPQSRGPLAVGIAAAALCLWPAPVLPASPNIRLTFLWPEPDTAAAADFAAADRGYGFANLGLYGEWPRILERAGYPVSRATRLDASRLSRTDVLVVVSAFRDWHPGESDAIIRWVRDGGRLLVVGEHSDLENCQQRLNPLLAEFGLGLGFDTTNGLLGDGLRGAIIAIGPLRRALAGIALLPYNRGASLEVMGSARALVVGRYWHADAGDPLAPERAFLSDYRVSRGDRLGDVVLMASYEGRGRVLLVGDSTPFLTQNTLYASPFLLAVPRYMARPPTGLFGSPAVAWLVALALGVLALALDAGQPSWRIVGFLAISAVATAGVRRSSELLAASAHAGVVSTAENNVLDLDPFSARSPTALGLAFSRAGLVPVLADWERLESRPSVLAILNPSRPPQTRRLVAWAREGTTVLLAGDGDNPAFRAAAAAFGVTVAERPLGNLKSDGFSTYASWEVASLPRGAQPLSAAGFVIGGLVPIGQGRLVVVADGGFFLSKNLEMETAFDETNLAFLRRLLGGTL